MSAPLLHPATPGFLTRRLLSRKSSLTPHASPAVRRFARELGVDLINVVGSGRKGRVLESDVKAYVRQVMRGEAPATGTGHPAERAGAAPAETDFQRFGEVQVQPLGSQQRRSGAALLQTWLNVPRVTHHQEADVTELEGAAPRPFGRGRQAGSATCPW